MWRALRIFVIIAVISAAAAWLAETSGDVIITWLGYRIETQFGVAVAAVALIAALCVGAYRLLRPLIEGPVALGRRWRARRTRLGYDALSKGMLALAAGDTQTARRMSQRTQRLLEAQPLTLLLSAQVAQLEGDSHAAEKYFTAMLDSPDTEFLGLRGLFIQANRNADATGALTYAARAFELDSKSRWAFDGLFSQQTRLSQWAAARRSVETALRGRLIDREHARRARTVLLTAESIENTASLPAGPEDSTNQTEVSARTLAMEAVALQPGFTPAALIAARLLSRGNKRRRAIRLIENAWRLNPHPDLAQAYERLKRQESKPSNGLDMSALARKNSDHIESKFLRVTQAIRERDWTTALECLEPLTEPFPTARACALMAEIEQRKNGDEVAARSWLGRGLHAARDPEWHCNTCGEVNPSWGANCAHCGAFDTLIWRSPISGVLIPVDEPAPAGRGNEARASNKTNTGPTILSPNGGAVPTNGDAAMQAPIQK